MLIGPYADHGQQRAAMRSRPERAHTSMLNFANGETDHGTGQNIDSWDRMSDVPNDRPLEWVGAPFPNASLGNNLSHPSDVAPHLTAWALSTIYSLPVPRERAGEHLKPFPRVNHFWAPLNSNQVERELTYLPPSIPYLTSSNLGQIIARNAPYLL